MSQERFDRLRAVNFPFRKARREDEYVPEIDTLELTDDCSTQDFGTSVVKPDAAPSSATNVATSNQQSIEMDFEIPDIPASSAIGNRKSTDEDYDAETVGVTEDEELDTEVEDSAHGDGDEESRVAKSGSNIKTRTNQREGAVSNPDHETIVPDVAVS